jgi:hypothetical protein
MTWIHDPYKHKLDGRSYNNRIGKPFYGSALKRLLDATPPESSYDRDRQMTWLIVLIAVPIAILLAALIVSR